LREKKANKILKIIGKETVHRICKEVFTEEDEQKCKRILDVFKPPVKTKKHTSGGFRKFIQKNKMKNLQEVSVALEQLEPQHTI